MAPVILLMGVGPLARWKSAPPLELARKLRWPALAAVAAALLLPWWAGHWSVGVAAGLFLAAWVFASTTALLAERVRAVSGTGLRARFTPLLRSPRSFYGMVLAHVGIGVFIVGVTMVKGYEVERDVKMGIGDGVSVGGHRFVFKGVHEVTGPNYVAVRATVEVQRDGGTPVLMTPEKRLYKVQQMPMTEAAIDAGFTRDLYVSLGEPLDENTWTVRIYHKPFIGWVWGGAVLMALGGLLAASDRRYRVSSRAAEAAAARATALAAPAAGPALGGALTRGAAP
jgi:cytochrome c-type biogenesis protein CcmF